MIRLACLGLVLLTGWTADAQKNAWSIGGKWTHDLTLNHGIARGGGVQAGYGISKKSALETGISYTTWDQHYYSGNRDGIYETVIAPRHLFIPLQYRFQSRNLVASAGLAADFFLGRKLKKTTAGFEVPEGNNPGTTLLATGGLGRSFPLCSGLSFEPELRFNYRFGQADGSLGLNLGLRKLFR